MTVTYAPSVSRTRVFGLIKLLFRWTGSIWKLILGEFIVFMILYYAIFLLNTFGLKGEHRSELRCIIMHWRYLRIAVVAEWIGIGIVIGSRFHGMIELFRDYTHVVPMSLLLGFYINQVTNRWWGTYLSLPWIQTPAVMVCAYIVGSTERARLVRRTLVRYLNIQMVLALRGISPPVRKRFPTLCHLVEAGIMTKSELKELNSTTHDYGNYYIPTLWFTNLLHEANDEGLLKDAFFKSLLDEAVKFRSSCGGLLGYDCINIPLIYTQVATLAVYIYFFVCLFARQLLPNKDQNYIFSQYFPLFTVVEFVLYVGWLKVGEVLINPLGGDDDDFDINSIIDGNFGVGALMVDRLYGTNPPVEKTKFWDMEKIEIPYTKASHVYFAKPHLGSIFDFVVSKKDSQWVRHGKSDYDQKISEEMEMESEVRRRAKAEISATMICLPDHN